MGARELTLVGNAIVALWQMQRMERCHVARESHAVVEEARGRSAFDILVRE